MSFPLEALMPLSVLFEHPHRVLDVVNRHGKAVILDKDVPAYVISKPDTLSTRPTLEKRRRYTLQHAMRVVLEESEDNQLHAADLADRIHEQGLYYRRDGGKAGYNQIRARCGNYPEMFEALPGNIIKLRRDCEG